VGAVPHGDGVPVDLDMSALQGLQAMHEMQGMQGMEVLNAEKMQAHLQAHLSQVGAGPGPGHGMEAVSEDMQGGLVLPTSGPNDA
jgi:hypothetical protein